MAAGAIQDAALRTQALPSGQVSREAGEETEWLTRP